MKRLAVAAALFMPISSHAWECYDRKVLYDYYSDGVHVGSGWETVGQYCFEEFQPYGNNYGGGGGGGGGTSSDCKSTDPATVDQYSDALANGAAADIKSRPDYNQKEYGAIIYRDAGGSVRISQVIPGTPTSVDLPGLVSSLGISRSQVLGFIHNHPHDVYDTSPWELQINLISQVAQVRLRGSRSWYLEAQTTQKAATASTALTT